MKVATSLADADVSHPSVVSIGNFDGLHLGHQEILKTVVKRSKELGVRSVAMTFSPHPMRVLAPHRPPQLISTLEQKIRLVEGAGIDLLFLARFDMEFSRLSPEEFIDKYLIHGLQRVRYALAATSISDTGELERSRRSDSFINTSRSSKSRLFVCAVCSRAAPPFGNSSAKAMC